jgi:hypothetical protein
LLVHLADLLNGRFQLLVVGQTTLYMSDLILTKTDLADTGAGIADGENGHGMSFTTLTLGAVGAVSDNPLEERTTQDFRGIGKRRGEAITFT